MDHPGYQWGAGHAMELAYLWPSFNNGFSLYDLLTPAQLELSRQMIRYWGAFVEDRQAEVQRPAVLAQVHQRPADVAAAWRPVADDLGGHLRRRAPVLLLERRITHRGARCRPCAPGANHGATAFGIVWIASKPLELNFGSEFGCQVDPR